MSSNRFAYVLLASSLLTTACGDDAQQPPIEELPRAKFADLTADQRSAIVSAGMGEAGAMTITALFMAEIDSSFGTCPARSVEGDVVTYDAGEGCAGLTGGTYKGRIDAKNAPVLSDTEDGIEVDPTKPQEFVFDGFSYAAPNAPLLALDGTMTQSPIAADGSATMSTKLAYSYFAALELDLTMTCLYVNGSTCTIAEGSLGSFEGLAFEYRGTIGNAGNGNGFEGWLEVEGEDLLRAEFEEGRACNPVTIDGAAAGELCVEIEPPPPETDLVVMTGGYLCDDLRINVLATVVNRAERVYVEIVNEQRSEEYDLVFDHHDDVINEDVWVIDIIRGFDTDLTCEEVIDAGMRITAVDSAGGSACFVVNEAGGIFDTVDCI